MRATALLALGLGLAVGCATTQDPGLHETPLEVKNAPEATEPLAPPARPAPFDPRAFMNGMVTPGECAAAAKRLHDENADRGWQALVACVEKGHFPRADFTSLHALLDGTWDEELATKADAPKTIARLIALRGGDVSGDLPKFLKVRAPVFPLASAIAAPQTYKGRYVLLRARIGDAKDAAGGTTTKLVETSLSAQLKEAEVEGNQERSSFSSSTNLRAEVHTSNYGSARGQASIDRSGQAQSGEVSVRYENEAHPTGLVALGRLARPDPFLEPGKQYVVLGRFEGVRRSPDDTDDDAPAAIVTVVAYFVPNALLID